MWHGGRAGSVSSDSVAVPCGDKRICLGESSSYVVLLRCLLEGGFLELLVGYIRVCVGALGILRLATGNHARLGRGLIARLPEPFLFLFLYQGSLFLSLTSAIILEHPTLGKILCLPYPL